MASYSGDELVAIYRYFRSLALDNPFTTARENLIVAFEKVWLQIKVVPIFMIMYFFIQKISILQDFFLLFYFFIVFIHIGGVCVSRIPCMLTYDVQIQLLKPIQTFDTNYKVHSNETSFVLCAPIDGLCSFVLVVCIIVWGF